MLYLQRIACLSEMQTQDQYSAKSLQTDSTLVTIFSSGYWHSQGYRDRGLRSNSTAESVAYSCKSQNSCSVGVSSQSSCFSDRIFGVILWLIKLIGNLGDYQNFWFLDELQILKNQLFTMKVFDLLWKFNHMLLKSISELFQIAVSIAQLPKSYKTLMKNPIINTSQDVFSANESQVKKIEFLTYEKSKTESYINDLQESLKLNKAAVLYLNKEGPNNQTISFLSEENQFLHRKLQICYEENRDLNAIRLFQAQIRIQDKSCYHQRVIQFQTRINDLRKYLHDKEDSFTNVVHRLKKYEDIQQLTMKEKLEEFKNEIGQPIQHWLIQQLSSERNAYKRKCDSIEITARKLEIIEHALKSRKNYDQIVKEVEQFDKKHGKNEKSLQGKLRNIVPQNVQEQMTRNLSKPINNKIDRPNTELIRLLKKEKLQNEILEQTLNDAIQKNEELLNFNEYLSEANNQFEESCKELRSEIFVLERRLAEFDTNYRKRLKDYSKCDLDKPEHKYSDFPNDLTRKSLLRILRKDVETISAFMNSKWGNGYQNQMKMGKSSSEPQLVNETGIEQDDFQIEAI